MFKIEDEKHIFITMHHLVIDNVSWRVIIQDLSEILSGKSKEDIKWRKTDSYISWNSDIKRYAFSVLKEKYEEDKICVQASLFGNYTMSCLSKEMKRVYCTLSEEQTELLLNRIHQRYGTKVQDILVTALALAIKNYYSGKTLRIQMESHGRQNDYSKLNVSRTVGWFTEVYPVDIDLKGEGYKDQIIEVKDKMNQVPNNGVGYNSYYYDLKKMEDIKEDAFISFNYLGEFENDLESEVFSVSSYGVGDEITGEYLRTSIDMNLEIKANQLVVYIDYGKNQYQKSDIDEFAKAYIFELEQIILYCMENKEQILTASDFSAEGIDADEIRNILSSL